MFNIRIYGILIDENRRVLVSDEFIRGSYITKFPGGGLEFGEGTRDCLRREFKEETGMDVSIGQHIYTTDFFQLSAFNQQHQIISIYYFVEAKEAMNLPVKTALFDFAPQQIADPNGEAEAFRWMEWKDFGEAAVTLPIDKIVAEMLRKLEHGI